MIYQEVNDMMQFADRLEKRLHDLKLSREITIQSAPQIRLIQNTNQALVEKIQSSIQYSYSTLEKPNCDCINTIAPTKCSRGTKTSIKNNK